MEISPERFRGWVESFTERHGGPVLVSAAGDAATITFTAADGAAAQCHPPFPPMAPFPPMPPGADPEAVEAVGAAGAAGAVEAVGAAGADRTDGANEASGAAAAIAAHAAAERTVGVFLVRLGGYAAGVFTGSPPQLAASKTGSRLVHGRSAAGGWSQHRFARRREKQVAEALDAAVGAAVTVFAAAGRLDVVVLGGDKRAVAAIRDDSRLAPYVKLATGRFLTVPDPKLAVLKDSPRLFRAIRVRLTEPPARAS